MPSLNSFAKIKSNCYHPKVKWKYFSQAQFIPNVIQLSSNFELKGNFVSNTATRSMNGYVKRSHNNNKNNNNNSTKKNSTNVLHSHSATSIKVPNARMCSFRLAIVSVCVRIVKPMCCVCVLLSVELYDILHEFLSLFILLLIF